jgi:hypothetical protein
VLWWRKGESVDIMKQLPTAEGRRRLPFIIKYVNKEGTQCSLCHWTARCVGCILLPTSKTEVNLMPSTDYFPEGIEMSSLFNFLKYKDHSHLVCEWDIDFIS